MTGDHYALSLGAALLSAALVTTPVLSEPRLDSVARSVAESSSDPSLAWITDDEGRPGWVIGMGSSAMGLDVTRRVACQRARERAISAAIRQVAPETLSSGEWMICREGKVAEECRMNRMVWGRVNGQLHAIGDEEKRWDGDSCTVRLRARVKRREAADPSFDFKVELNRTVFRDEESLEITVQPAVPMYLTIFQWLPYVDSTESVHRIFPNARDPLRRFNRLSTIPTRDAGYTMKVRFPETIAKDKDGAIEFIMAVATKEKVQFLKSFTLEQFERKLAELSSTQYRLQRRGYQVVRGR